MPSDKDRLYVALYVRDGEPLPPGVDAAPPSSSAASPDAEPAIAELEDTSVDAAARARQYHELALSRYHWALMIGPKHETPRSRALLCQARIGPEPRRAWYYEARDVCMKPTPRLLVRVLVAKVRDRPRLEAILRAVRVAEAAAPGAWNCIDWLRDALAAVGKDGKALGTAFVDWQYVINWTMWYVDEKRRQGRYEGFYEGRYDPDRPPTWDLIDSKELLP